MTDRPATPFVSRIAEWLAAGAGIFVAGLLNAFAGRHGYSLSTNILYGAGPRHVLDVYTPDGAGSDTPVVVYFHGGGWDSGSKDMYRFIGQALASGEVIAVLPEYRLYPEVTFPAFVEDAARAVAWVAGNLASGRRMFLCGHSAGAHIAALLNLDARYLVGAGLARTSVTATIGIAGPYDFLPLTEDRYKAVFPEAVRAASQPIAFVDGAAPPMLLLTGEVDRTVKPGNTTRLAAAIRSRGGEVEEIVYPGIGHLGMLAALAQVLPVPKPPVRRDLLAFIHAVAGRR